VSPEPKGKDTLMEALMDLDDDGLDDEEGEVVFGGGDDGRVEGGPSGGGEAACADAPGGRAAGAVPSDEADAPAATTAEASPPPPTAEGGGVGTGTAANGDIPSAGGTTPNDVTAEVGHRAEGAKPGSDHPSELEPDTGSEGDDDMADPDVEDANEDFGDADDDFDDFDDDAELEDLEASVRFLGSNSCALLPFFEYARATAHLASFIIFWFDSTTYIANAEFFDAKSEMRDGHSSSQSCSRQCGSRRGLMIPSTMDLRW